MIEHIERIRLTSQIPLSTWSEMLAVSPERYRLFTLGAASLPGSSLEELAGVLQVDLKALVSGEIDYRAVARSMLVNKGIPESYTKVAYSRLRTIISMLDGLEAIAGWRARLDVIQRFGLNELVLADATRPANMQLITDMCRYLSPKVRPDDFFTLGAYSVVTHQGTPLAAEYSKVYRIGQLWERLLGDLLPHYEQSSEYRITEMTATGCQVEVRSRPEVAAALGVRHLGCPEICAIKSGLLACVPGYLGLPFADVVHTRCVHAGDSVCTYEIAFGTAARRFADHEAMEARATGSSG